MDFNSITLFGAIKKRIAWLNQRQEVLAQNIANADTPGYRPRDLMPFDFTKLLAREARQVRMSSTDPMHMTGRRRDMKDFAGVEVRKPYETAPDGNAVVLEEQVMKVNDTMINHKLMTELYKKHMGMFRVAIGKGR